LIITPLFILFWISKNVTQNAVKTSDFISYYLGYKLLSNGETKLFYDIETQNKLFNQLVNFKSQEFLPFRTLPPILILFIFSNFLDYYTAYIVWTFVNLSIGVFVFCLISKQLKLNKLYSVFVFSSFYPLSDNFIRGQVILVFLSILLLAFILIKNKKVFLSGFASSFLILRPRYLLFIPFLFLKLDRKIDYAKGFILGIVLNLLITLRLISFEGFLSYPKFLFNTETPTYGSFIDRYLSLYPLLMKFLFLCNQNLLIILAINFVLFTVTVLTFSLKVNKLSYEVVISIGIISILLFGVHINTHDLAILIYLLFVLLTKVSLKYKKVGFLLFLLLYFLSFFCF